MPKQISPDIIIGEVLHEWSIPEYEQYQRNKAWYIIMFVLGGSMVLYAILSNNFLFALIIILFAIILFLQSHQQPIVIPFKITEMGVVVNNRFYSYIELDSFYLFYNPPDVKTLFIETRNVSRPKLRVPLMDMDPNEIRATLKEFLEEDLEKEEEPISDMIGRKWQIH
ncbi:MAG: hypothetical protein WCW16_05070 [Candidatus Magasanikbacteria bacterium]